MTKSQLAKYMKKYGISISRQGIIKEYIKDGKYIKTDNDKYGKREAQIIAKVRLLKDFLNLEDCDVREIVGVYEVDPKTNKRLPNERRKKNRHNSKEANAPKVYISDESDESWSKLFDMVTTSYYEHRKKLLITRLDSEREKHNSEWFKKVNWLELYKQYSNYEFLEELILDGIIEKIANEVILNDSTIFLKDDAKRLFRSFDFEVKRLIELMDKQVKEIKTLGFLDFANLQNIYPEFIRERFQLDKLKYYELLVAKLLDKIYPDGSMSTLAYDEQLLATLFLGQCNDHLLLMVLGNQAILATYLAQVELDGNLSIDTFNAYINEFRNGIPAEQYVEIYNTYLEDHYIKIKTCSVYLLNEYLVETEFGCSLTAISIEEIKNVAKEKFGLPTPAFKVMKKN